MIEQARTTCLNLHCDGFAQTLPLIPCENRHIYNIIVIRTPSISGSPSFTTKLPRGGWFFEDMGLQGDYIKIQGGGEGHFALALERCEVFEFFRGVKLMIRLSMLVTVNLVEA